MLNVENLNTRNSIKTLEELKESELPLFLWGAGNLADEVYRILQENGIVLNGVFVSDNYGVRGKFGNYNITALQDILEQNKKINVIIGHAQYHRKEEMEKIEGINKVYYILNPFRTHDDISYDYYLEHKEEYDKAYALFDEEYSQRVFQAYLNARVNDELQYLLDSFNGCSTYFNNHIFSLSQCESYVDIGAYNGDTLRKFMEETNLNYEHVYAFEPDTKLFNELEDYVREAKLLNVDLYKLGLWNKSGELFFESDLGQSDRVVESGELNNKIEVVKLDDILDGKEVTFIKGALSTGTLEWIEGAKEILITQKPKLVISVGITKELLYAVPLLVHEINAEYKLFLRFLESMPSRLFLFAY